MGYEYRIGFEVPDGYDPSRLAARLPPAHAEPAGGAIYGYAVEPDGFYFVDHLVDPAVASLAFRRLVDEALTFSDSVGIAEL